MNKRREEDFIHATVPMKMNEFELAEYRKEDKRPEYLKSNETSPRYPEVSTSQKQLLKKDQIALDQQL